MRHLEYCVRKKTRDMFGAGPYRFCVASDRPTRERAYRLAFQVYRGCGLATYDASERVVSPFDTGPNAFTLLVETAQGESAGTVSLVMDSAEGLPCDEIYQDRLVDLRANDRRLMEVTRLAISEKHKHSRMLLVALFDFISVFARHCRQATDFVIEVHPRHVNYYQRMLLFEVIGPPRPCPRVVGSPAVLMRLDLLMQQSEIAVIGGSRGRARSAKGRTLYAWFASIEEEKAIAAFLRRHHRPMTAEDAEYFGLAEHAEPAGRRRQTGTA